MIKVTLLDSWPSSMHITQALVLTWERLVQIRLEFYITTPFSYHFNKKRIKKCVHTEAKYRMQ